MKIEIIIPCYNEEKCVKAFFDKVQNVFSKQLSQYEYSLLFVDDGSSDNTLLRIKELEEKHGNSKIRYISFSRNFGKEAAIYVGLSNSTGDYVTVMDADLQHPPELLTDMVFALENEGYDCAAARRISREGEPIIKSFFSHFFYYLINRVTSINLVSGATDYRLMKRNVVESVVSLQERERFTKGIFSWVGFKTKWIEYKNVERVAGESKWSFLGLLSYAKNGYIAFATAPLRGVIYFGMLIVFFAFAYAIYVFASAILYHGNRTGYASIMIVLLFLGGVIIATLGIIGEYLARIYMEVKKRPLYIEKEKNF